jgi:tetratricopeptide (TPR) repeat protein
MKRTVLAFLLCALGTGALVACGGDQPAAADAGNRFAAVDELFRAGDFKGAAKTLEARRAQEGDDPDLVQRLGYAYEKAQDPAKAVMTYRGALETHPDAGKLWMALGNDYLELDQLKEAVPAIERARELGVEDSFTAMSLGICRARLKDHEAAEKEFQRALAAGEDPGRVRFNIALLRVDEKHYREAKELLDQVLADDPQNYEASRELGNVLLQTTQDPDTIARVQRMEWDVVDHRPEDWRAHMLLGDAFMAAQDYEAAVEAYTDALRFGKNPPEVEQRYLEAASAKRDLERAAAKEPDDGQAASAAAPEPPEKNSH